MIVILSTSIEVEEMDEYKAKQKAKEKLFKMLTRPIEDDEMGALCIMKNMVLGFSASIQEPPGPSYYEQAQEEAKDFIVDCLLDEILNQFIEDGEIGTDIRNDFDDGDSAFHETIVDRSYSTEEAIDLIDDLSDYEETDSGLWEGQDWDDILSTKAAFTYGNAVYDKASNLIEWIRDDTDMDEIDRLAIRSTLKQFSKKSMTKEDRRIIREDGLRAWLQEAHGDIFEKTMRNILTERIKEIIEEH